MTNMNVLQTIESDVVAAQSGDTKAFTRLVEKTRNTVTSISLAIVKDLDSSEDVAQQVYIAVWEGLKNLKSSASFMPWVRQTTRYKSYNYLRDNKLNYRVDSEVAEQMIEAFCSADDIQETHIHRNEQSTILGRFIDELPDDSREIILLYYREEHSSRQVAALLDISETLVRKRISRVRKELKSRLLAKYGRLILSTAPTVGFSSLLASAMMGTSPAAAATLATTLASSKSTIGSKLLALSGGASLGIASGIAGAWWEANKQMKSISDEVVRARLARYRNQLILWIIVTGSLLTLSYEFTSGWFWPTISYFVFIGGLVKLIWRTNFYYDCKKYGNRELTREEQRQRGKERLCGIWGTVLGAMLGFMGLMYGLVSSGRF